MVIWPIETGVMVTNHGSGRRQGNSTLILEQMFVHNQVIFGMLYKISSLPLDNEGMVLKADLLSDLLCTYGVHRSVRRSLPSDKFGSGTVGSKPRKAFPLFANATA
jgi:hypothetical protein